MRVVISAGYFAPYLPVRFYQSSGAISIQYLYKTLQIFSIPDLFFCIEGELYSLLF